MVRGELPGFIGAEHVDEEGVGGRSSQDGFEGGFEAALLRGAAHAVLRGV